MVRPINLQAREKILQAAARLMLERGFQAVSMDDVARAARIKKANLFHYYPTKEVLGLAVFDHVSELLRERLAGQLSGDKDPIRAVEGMFQDLADGMKKSRCRGGCFIGNLAQELGDHYGRMRTKVAAAFKDWACQLAAALEGGRARGVFRRDLNPQEAAEAILSLYEGATLMCKANQETKPLENAKQMAVFYLRGYKK